MNTDKIPLIGLSKDSRASDLGIIGHVGVGHVHSHSGFVHDDSAGFAVIASLMQDALPVDLRIAEVHADARQEYIEVVTASGGRGKARPRRGITPTEGELMLRAVGRDASQCQAAAIHVFGRMYGQGVSECAACFEAAAAFAAMDSFIRHYPDQVEYMHDTLEGNVDLTCGVRVRYASLNIALMAVINHSVGGLGPNEDNEGSAPYGPGKTEVMRRLGMERAPAIIIESKAYVPARCEDLTSRVLLTRVNRDVDNFSLAQALIDAAARAAIPMQHDLDTYPRNDGALSEVTRTLGKQFMALGSALMAATTSSEKVRIIGEVARLVSEDAGGVTFMSNDWHDIVGSGGMFPGSGAMLSMLVPHAEAQLWKVPVLFDEDTRCYRRLIKECLNLMPERLTEVRREQLEKQAQWCSSRTLLVQHQALQQG